MEHREGADDTDLHRLDQDVERPGVECGRDDVRDSKECPTGEERKARHGEDEAEAEGETVTQPGQRYGSNQVCHAEGDALGSPRALLAKDHVEERW